MESAILILVALLLGYGQGIKQKRRRAGKEGGILQNITERITRKGRLIREQKEEIYNLKEELLSLKRKMENGRQEGGYFKGTAIDFKKDFLCFIWDNKNNQLEAIKCFFLLNILIMYIPELKDEKYTKYNCTEVLLKIDRLVADRKKVTHHKIGCIDYAFDFDDVWSDSNNFFRTFNNYNYDMTYEEMKECFIEILEKIGEQ